MPFKSEAQRKFMFSAESRGEIPKGTAKRWAKHTKGPLPERVKQGSLHDLYIGKYAEFGFSPKAARTAAMGAGGLGALKGLMTPNYGENRIESALKNAIVWGLLAGGTAGVTVGTIRKKILKGLEAQEKGPTDIERLKEMEKKDI